MASRRSLGLVCSLSSKAIWNNASVQQAPAVALLLAALAGRAAGARSLVPLRSDALLLPWNGFAAAFAAKGGKAKGGGSGGKKAAAAAAEDDAEAEQPEFDPTEIETAMAAAVEHLQHELSGIRTGRANPGLLENIPVDAYGERVPLKAVGAVTVRNPQLLAVSVFDAGLVPSVVKAIQTSPLSLAPAAEGGEVLVKLPRMTRDTVEKMIKLVHMEVEGAHQSIRHARQKGMDAVKKAFKGGSEDERKRTEKEVQRLHDAFLAEVERLKKAKDAELREHRD